MEHSNVMQMKPSTSYTIVTICTGYRFHKAANVKEEEKKKEKKKICTAQFTLETMNLGRSRERE